MIYRVSFRTAQDTQRNPFLKNKTKQHIKEKKGKREKKKKQEKKLQSRPTLSSIGSKELSDWTEDQGVIHNWDARNLRLMLQPC